MDLITLDFETYYATDYGLRKFTTEEYIRHKSFEVIGVSVKVNSEEAVWFSGTKEQTKRFLDGYNWGCVAIAHNAVFDMAILNWHFDIRPKRIADTLSMARALHGTEVGGSLDALVTHYGLGVKGKEVLNALGKHRIDFTAEELERYGEYCKNDSELTHKLFGVLGFNFPVSELRLIDLTVRMFTEPTLSLDAAKLIIHLENVQIKKAKLMERLKETKADLLSNLKFAELLKLLGVEPPMKISPATGKDTYAFAKSDEAFKALLEHENTYVQTLVAARLGVKSTIEETRTERLLGIAKRGLLPIPLRYYAAHTGRWGGDDKVNMQNLPRKSPLKHAICVPKGFVLVDSDSSQIEARTLAWLAGQDDLVAAFEKGEDVYSIMASAIYNKPIAEVTKDERFVGKSVILGCGYGLGALKLKAQLKTFGVDITEEEANGIIHVYRETYPRIPKLWRQASRALEAIKGDQSAPLGLDGVLIVRGTVGIQLPNGLYLKYPNLRDWANSSGKLEQVYDTKRGKTLIPNRIYGGKVIENCIAKGTEVLTDRGWVAIELVGFADKVHDGVEFVKHGGIVYKSVQACVTIDGVYMTPDHEVLTDDGWKTASQNPRPYRPDLWNVDGVEPGAQQREEAELALSMPVREAMYKSGGRYNQRGQAWRDSQLRVRDQATYLQGQHNTRHEQTSSVCSVEVDAGSLPPTYTSGMGKLRWPGYQCMRSLARSVHEFLGRHGVNLCTGLGLRPDKQRGPVLAGELPMGFPAEQQYEQTQHRAQSGRSSPKPANGDCHRNTVLPISPWVARGPTSTGAQPEKSVYDIVDAGRRSRFVVRGSTGPFIVHNCCQALARIVIGEQMLAISKRYKVVMTVHDAIACLVPTEEADEGKAFVEGCMKVRPTWAQGLPLNCEAGMGLTYGDC